MKKRETVKRIELKKIAILLGCLCALTINTGKVANAQEICLDTTKDTEQLMYYTLITRNDAKVEFVEKAETESISPFAEVIEDETPLEEWMLDVDNEFWKEIRMDLNEEVVEEQEIELEPWMLSTANWQ